VGPDRVSERPWRLRSGSGSARGGRNALFLVPGRHRASCPLRSRSSLVIRPRCVGRRLPPTGQTSTRAKRIARSNKRSDFGLKSSATASEAPAPKINTGTGRGMTSKGSTTPPRRARNTTAAPAVRPCHPDAPTPVGRLAIEASQVRYPDLGCRRANDRAARTSAACSVANTTERR